MTDGVFYLRPLGLTLHYIGLSNLTLGSRYDWHRPRHTLNSADVCSLLRLTYIYFLGPVLFPALGVAGANGITGAFAAALFPPPRVPYVG